MEKLTHLIYASTETRGMDAGTLNGILHAARVKNAQRSVTGMLLHTAGSFFQVLEGDEATLDELYAIIAGDPRHCGVTKIIQEPIVRRVFGGWTMGYSEVDPAELESIEGFSDFFREGHSLADLPAGRAKKLLTTFSQGRWRGARRATAHEPTRAGL